MKKTSILLTGLLIAALALNLSAQTLPKTGAALSVSEKSLELTQGQTSSVIVSRLRSKSYRKASFGDLRINGPEGLTTNFTKDANNPDQFTLEITPSNTMDNGKYTLVLQGEGRNASKVKGTMITILVSTTSLAKSN